MRMKTILENMYGITEKMHGGKKIPEGIIIDDAGLKLAATELRALRKALGMSTMQVLILTAIIHKSSRYRIDADEIASFLGMEYLKFLTHDCDLEELRKRGYIRIDDEGHINVPKEVLRCLKSNQPVVPEPTTGLTTSKILSRVKKILAIRHDDQMTTREVFRELNALMEGNPDTSIVRSARKYAGDLCLDETVLFFVLIYRYWYEKDDMVGWNDIDDYFDEDALDELLCEFRAGILELQVNGVIEYAGMDGMLTKDFFKIKDAIKEEIFADVGGVRKAEAKVSASRKLAAADIGRKVLFYNPQECRQVAQLKELMSEGRFGDIREKMKDKGHRTGFTCLFYGNPGTGKTETVYQIARESRRDLYIVDVSQIKSCWVGESEKNIKDVFDKYRTAVKAGDNIPILLFNEADAIFGIRQQGAERAVDKMENSIQNIILQEMEDLDGILIATTNLTTNLDKAFERRFLYKIRFEKPSLEARVSIWRSMLPELSEGEAIQLATDFDFSGGQIENVARKREVQAIIGLKEPGFADIREFCMEECLGSETDRKRIGF